jgi:hypothetical protein
MEKMRKTISILAILFVSMIFYGRAYASPMYYTFKGTINSIYDNAGIVADQGLSGGSEVEFLFLIDFDEDGYVTRNSGAVNYYVDYSYADYFYDDFVSGSILPEEDGGYWNWASSIAEYNYGFDQASGTDGLYGGSQDSFIQIFSTNDINTWDVGDHVTGLSKAYNSSGQYSFYYAYLTITSVPEPPTLLLLGSAIAGLALMARRRAKQ